MLINMVKSKMPILIYVQYFILYNQAEYMAVMEKIPMGETLLATRLLSPILDLSHATVGWMLLDKLHHEKLLKT